MAEYHVGYEAFRIYAGTLNRNKTMWRNKSDVTEEAQHAVAQYLLMHQEEIRFTYNDKKYVLKVESYDEEEE